MDALRVGRAIRAVRRQYRWTQAEVAARASVSPSSVSRIETGTFRHMPLAAVLSVAAVLEVHLDLVPRWRGEALDRLLDAAHAALVDDLVNRYRRSGWEVAVEVSFAINGERGAVDLLAFHPAASIVAVNEVKSVVPDAQATIHAHDRKTRLARQIALERDWRPRRIARFLAIGEGRTSRRRIEALPGVFSAAYPLQGRAALAWIDDPAGALDAEGVERPISGLFFLSPARSVKGAGQVVSRHRVRPHRAA
jgi:transcriptional regulator with XRE-family HTH domain